MESSTNRCSTPSRARRVNEKCQDYDASHRQSSRRNQGMETEGWVEVPGCDYGRWIFDDNEIGHAGALPTGISRHSTLVDVFDALFPSSLIDDLVSLRQKDRPSILLKPNTKTSKFDLGEIRQYYGIRAHIQAEQYSYEKGTLRKPFAKLWQDKIRPYFGEGCKLISRLNYEHLHSQLWMPCEFARGALSKVWSTRFTLSEFAALDEKMFKWRGVSPCIRNVKSKPVPIGHWTSQLCARLAGSGLPICLGMYPFDKCTTLGEKQKICDVWSWAIQLIGTPTPRPVLVADSYYLDNSSRPLLQEKEQPYMCSIKGDRFKVMVDRVKAKVKQPGEWFALHNTRTGELLMHHFSRDDNVKRKTLLTNAMRVEETGKQSQFRPPGWKEYCFCFSVCDEFNTAMKDRNYPFRRGTYLHNFDDLFFTSLLINVRNVWVSFNFEERSMHSYSACFNMLAQQLVNQQ